MMRDQTLEFEFPNRFYLTFWHSHIVTVVNQEMGEIILYLYVIYSHASSGGELD